MGNEQSTHKHNGLQTKVEEATLQHPNGGLNGHTVQILENSVVSEVAVQISCEAPTSAPSLELALDHTDDSSFPVPEESQCHAEKVQQIQETPAESEIPSPDLPKEDPNETAVKFNLFDKLFKKKTESPSIADNMQETKIPTENSSSPVADDPQSEPAEPKEDSVTSEESNCESVTPTPEEGTTPEAGEVQREHLVETQEGESAEVKTVMNFFKTLVNPTKTPKKEKVSPDVAVDPIETPPATTTAAAVEDAPAPTQPKGMSIPPPPPPEPPKVESKAETTPKPVITEEEPKHAAKEPEAAKAKSSKDNLFSILFRPKVSKTKGATSSGTKAPVKASAVTAEMVPQTIDVQKVDASKASTLEAAAKPEPPPVVPEEATAPPKASSFQSFLKPGKVLLDQMASKVQTASASGVRLLMKTTGGAAEPKKEPSAPPAEPEAAQAVKTKEEPKAAPKAPAPEAPVDNQSGTSQSGEDPANIPRKLEKRNSIHLFFKNLGKRHPNSGVQTEAASSASEKAK